MQDMYYTTIPEATGLNDEYDLRRTAEPAELGYADKYQVSDGVRKVMLDKAIA